MTSAQGDGDCKLIAEGERTKEQRGKEGEREGVREGERRERAGEREGEREGQREGQKGTNRDRRRSEQVNGKRAKKVNMEGKAGEMSFEYDRKTARDKEGDLEQL